MELALDIGSDVYENIKKASEMEQSSLETTASAMLALGVKIFLNSKNEKTDPTTQMLLKNTFKSNELLREILYMCFDKNKSNLGVYDAETAIALIERMTNQYLNHCQYD